MKQSDTGLIEYLNEEVDKIKRHGCIVPRVEMGTKDFLDTIAIINRQKAEIERLEEENRRMKKYYFTHDYHECHNEAIKEFAERLKKAKQYSLERHENIVPVAVIDWIVKELTEESNGKSQEQ